MDPDDLALIQQYLGRTGQQGQPQPSKPGQDLADALQQHAIAQGLGPLGPQVSPEDLQRCQDFAEAIKQHALQNRLPGQPISPAFTADYSRGAGAGPGLPAPAAGGSPPQSGSGSMYPSDRSYTQPFAHSASPQSSPSLASTLGSPGLQQMPSPGSQGAASDELLKRGVDPNADYYPSDNDALANLARGRAAPSWDPVPKLNVPAPASVTKGIPPLPSTAIGPHGYMPTLQDENLLARMIIAEGGITPEDFPAVGWSTVNRIGLREFGQTLQGVVDHKNAFQSLEKGGGPIGGSAQWRLTADPSKLTGRDLAKWRQAQQVAHGILSGAIADPTGGAQYFFSSHDLDGDAVKASRGWFRRRFEDGTLQPVQYQGHKGVDKDGPRRNYFAIETPKTGTQGR